MSYHFWTRDRFQEALANNEILQILVFSAFFGIAVAAVGEAARRHVARWLGTKAEYLKA